MQGKTFYNGGSPLMLGVVSDVTPAPQQHTASAPMDVPGKKAALAN
jgi:hypothetical protein